MRVALLDFTPELGGIFATQFISRKAMKNSSAGVRYGDMKSKHLQNEGIISLHYTYAMLPDAK